MISSNDYCIRSPILKSLLISLQISFISSQFSSSCWSVCKSAAVAEWARCVKFLGIKKVCSDLLKQKWDFTKDWNWKYSIKVR
jgi:hypothetical protein